MKKRYCVIIVALLFINLQLFADTVLDKAVLLPKERDPSAYAACQLVTAEYFAKWMDVADYRYFLPDVRPCAVPCNNLHYRNAAVD